MWPRVKCALVLFAPKIFLQKFVHSMIQIESFSFRNSKNICAFNYAWEAHSDYIWLSIFCQSNNHSSLQFFFFSTKQYHIICIYNKMEWWTDYNKQRNTSSFRQMLSKAGQKIMRIISPVRDRDQVRDGENEKCYERKSKGQERRNAFLMLFLKENCLNG